VIEGPDGPILLVGCGKMGHSMLSGWTDRGMDPNRVHIVEPNEDVASLLSKKGVKVFNQNCEIPSQFVPTIIIFAVKPQVMELVVPNYSHFKSESTVFLSIAAGKKIAFFEQHLGDDAAIVRAMPNTPAAVQRGITVACGNTQVSNPHKQQCLSLLRAVGEAEWIEDEDLIDAVTAISGGGPAYVFLLTEAMTKAGVDSGLPQGLSARLARATVSGAGELMRQSDEHPSTLRENVTSPGGTTEEALRVLMSDDAWQTLMDRAIAAATARSRKLA